jgi:hypothetical protein
MSCIYGMGAALSPALLIAVMVRSTQLLLIIIIIVISTIILSMYSIHDISSHG